MRPGEMAGRARMWIRSLALRRRLEREMREEMAEHLERSAARLIARGMPADEARREAMREFGNVAWLQEEARYARGTVWLDAIVADLRFALRHFARTPGTTVAIFLVLVVGMSISTLLFTGLWSYAAEPPPGIEREDDLVRIRGSRMIGRDCCVTRTFERDEFDGYRKLTSHFDAVAGWSGADVVLRVEGDAAKDVFRARATFVTENYFPVLGIQPVLGPGLPTSSAGDGNTNMVAVLGHSTWVQLFGRDPGIIGSAVSVNGVPVTIVGIAPERFRGLPDPGTLQLWLPLSNLQVLVPNAPDWFRAVGRLRAGVSTSEATAAVQVVASRATESSEELRLLDPSAEVVPLLARNSYAGFEEETRYLSVAVSVLGLLIMLIICTNASTLLTGLATARRHEIAVRLSLGAARRRLIRQLLTESALLACVAGILALGVVWSVLRAVTAFVPLLPFELSISWPATAFAFGIALSVGVLFGLAPALHATRLALAGVLHDSSAAIVATRARLQRGLVVAQIALTQPLIVLLAASLLLVIGELQPRRQSEFADRVIATLISLPAPPAGSPADESLHRLHVVMRRLVERLENTPGVEAVAVFRGGASPLGSYVVDVEDRVGLAPSDPIRLSGTPADPRYFEVMGIPLVRGRAFTFADAGAQTAETSIIVDDGLARKLWGERDPMGRRLRATADTASIRTLVVVGVIDVPEVESASPVDDYQIHVPADSSQPSSGLLIRTASLAEPLLPTIRSVINEEAPATVISLRTLAQAEAADVRTFRMLTSGVSAAGLMALLLSAIGLYAVVAFSVGQRTREIAIRIAVGSSRQQLVRRFLTDGLRLSAIGLVLGLPISLLGLRALTILLRFPWPVMLPPITAIATTGVILVATIAVWIPARRAASVDPAATLRRD